jgi:hypothetical protein
LKVGNVYAVWVGNSLRPVRILSAESDGAYRGRNLQTRRPVKLRGGERVLDELRPGEAGSWQFARLDERSHFFHRVALHLD